MQIVIVEDESPALRRLIKLVNEIAPDIVVAGTADSIASAIKLFNTMDKIDLALFDIELADGQSFEIFSQVSVPCPVIFTTAYDAFALKAFKLNSIDYLLKPIDKDELKNAIEKFRKQFATSSNETQNINALIDLLNEKKTNFKNRFLLKIGTRFISVSTNEMSYFYAADKLVYVTTIQGQKLVMDHSLDELESMLDPKLFFRINRQCIAQVKAIKSIHAYFNGKLKVELEPPITAETMVSKERASAFRKWLDE